MKAFLILETGEVYEGLWRGKDLTPKIGEVVFNTSHSGYEEIATDPSYFNQIVVMTAPMMGNYGVDSQVWESRRMWIEGFIALQIQESAGDRSWLNRLDENQVAAVSDLDTRSLVLRLRSGGTPWGVLLPAATRAEAQDIANKLLREKKAIDKDWVYLASRKEKQSLVGQSPDGPKIAVLDFGAKENILRELVRRSKEVVIFNSRASADEILSFRPDGLMLTNGPGDPADVQVAPKTVSSLIGKLPIFGICMGHQVLALALGAQTYKLKFGHRGSNHPIKDELLGAVYMTAQNHGYAVKSETLPSDVRVTQVNLNDSTCAGFFSETKNCLGIQYHPESCPGPHEASPLFDFFIEKMIQKGAP